MADIVVGVGTSHTPLLTIPPDLWASFVDGWDRRNPSLVYPPAGVALSYEEGELRSRELMGTIDFGVERFREQFAAMETALNGLSRTLRDAEPDVAVIISNDQEEWFYEDNMPSLAVYWGESVPIVPEYGAGDLAPYFALAFGDRRCDVPVQSDLAVHLIRKCIDYGFDVSHFNYVNQPYGGRVGRRYPSEHGETDVVRVRPPREQGLPHGFAFVVQRLFGATPCTIVPVFQNTCYPPNAVRPDRCFEFGRAVARAIGTWERDARVAVIASGGLSHWVVDEEVDQLVLNALRNKDEQQLRSLPTHRLQSAASESLNWVTLAGALQDTPLEMELLEYVASYRSPAATGGGWAFARWLPGNTAPDG